MDQSTQTLYERIGGAATVARVADEFSERVRSDDALTDLAAHFAAADPAADPLVLLEHQRAFVARAVGAPAPYPGHTLHPAHQLLGVPAYAFDLLVGHLVAALLACGVDRYCVTAIGAAVGALRAEALAGAVDYGAEREARSA
ncbi:globin domain-containing protein [Streptomyces sp. NPDC002851]